VTDRGFAEQDGCSSAHRRMKPDEFFEDLETSRSAQAKA